MEITRQFVPEVTEALRKGPALIQVIIGPRQVGKTTGIKQVLAGFDLPSHYVSADGNLLKSPAWITEQWIVAKSQSANTILVIDEIQKVENWAEEVKRLWDQQDLRSDHIKVILLGSSSLELQKGLSESLTGRFRLHKVPHWTPRESQKAYGIGLDEFLRFGGYPGSYPLIQDKINWLIYVQHSIIDTVIGKDILSIARVKSPSLFKQCFDLACSYACQEISYTKLLGQLQDKGNTDLIKHYLDLFEQAFLLKQLFKFSNKKVLTRSSSPKILPLCPALYSVTLDADYSREHYGRAFELTVGSLLSNFPGELFYWRQNQLEVDFVYQFGRKIWAIEVKTNEKSNSKGLLAFQKEFPNAELLLINKENYIEELSRIWKTIQS